MAWLPLSPRLHYAIHLRHSGPLTSGERYRRVLVHYDDNEDLNGAWIKFDSDRHDCCSVDLRLERERGRDGSTMQR